MSRALSTALTLLVLCVLISLSTVATAAPVVHDDDSYVVAVGSDPHLDFDHYQTGVNPLIRHFAAAELMNADASLLLGDLFGARKSDLDGNRTWDCTVDRAWSPTCEYPSTWLGALYTVPRASWSGPSWVLGGNHDGHPPIPQIPALSSPNEWWITLLNPLDEEGVVYGGGASELSHQLIRVELPSGTWDLLLLHDMTWMQDRAQGGRCDFRDYSGLDAFRAGCSTRGWPIGVIADEQLLWLESAIAEASIAGRFVLVATHAPPANTVALSTRATSYVQACAGSTAISPPQPPIFVQSPDSAAHFPRDADLLPLRTDLDMPIPGDPYGRTPLQAAHEHVGSLVRWPLNGLIDEDWALKMVRRYPGTVRLWLSGHNHLPVPDFVDSVGRGVRFDDALSGTTFLAHGALTWKWHTTSGVGRPQGARLELHGDGSWAWERWSLQTFALGLWPLGCTTSASLPSTRPGPWVGLPIETGP